MSQPIFSIITPTFNSEKTLVDCIESVMRQSFKDFEYWLIDACSSDKTTEILQHYAENYPNIYFVSEKDNGIYDAMNKGLNKARGTFLYFLGSDDELFDDEVLADVFAVANDTENYDFIHGNVMFKESQIKFGEPLCLRDLKRKSICHQAVFVKKTLHQQKGSFDTSYQSAADNVFFIKCFHDAATKIKYIDRMIANFSIQGLSSKQKDQKFISNKWYLFENLTFLEKIKRLYYQNRPSWFVPSRLWKKI